MKMFRITIAVIMLLLIMLPCLSQMYKVDRRKNIAHQYESGSSNSMPVAREFPEFDGWTFDFAEALRVHANYTLKDFRIPNINTKYAWLHMNEFMPSATVGRKGPVSILKSKTMQAIGQVIVTKIPEPMTLNTFINRSQLQGIIVIYKGNIVYERYPRMLQSDRHLYFSVSKTFTGSSIALLEEEGKINLQDTAGKYLPELNSGSWGGIKIIDVLNMSSGMTPQFDDPGARTDSNNLYFQFESVLGIQIKTSATNEGIWAALNKMQSTKRPGLSFEYGGHNTLILSMIVERVSGQTFSAFISSHIWNKTGAEADAYFSLSPEGIAVSSAAMTGTLRDLARYGLLYTPSWRVVSDSQIISKGIIEKIEHADDNGRFDRGAFGRRMIDELGEKPSHNAYQWDFVMQDGDFFKAGLNGQGLYISPKKDLVIACFSHGDYQPGISVAFLSRAIARSLP